MSNYQVHLLAPLAPNNESHPFGPNDRPCMSINKRFKEIGPSAQSSVHQRFLRLYLPYYYYVSFRQTFLAAKKGDNSNVASRLIIRP